MFTLLIDYYHYWILRQFWSIRQTATGSTSHTAWDKMKEFSCLVLIFIPEASCLLAQADILWSHPSIKLKERGVFFASHYFCNHTTIQQHWHWESMVHQDIWIPRTCSLFCLILCAWSECNHQGTSLGWWAEVLIFLLEFLRLIRKAPVVGYQFWLTHTHTQIKHRSDYL